MPPNRKVALAIPANRFAMRLAHNVVKKTTWALGCEEKRFQEGDGANTRAAHGVCAGSGRCR
jgi:hypothetical protein